MKVACLYIHHLATTAELQRQPALKGKPVIISTGTDRTVLDASRSDLKPGMPLSAAISRYKDATVLEADMAYYEKVFEQVVSALETRGAEVEPATLGLAYLNVKGLAPLYGGDNRLMAALLNAIPSYLGPRLGLGPNKFTAYVAAVTSSAGSVVRAADCIGTYLTEFSVDFLPVPWRIRDRLHSFGLHTLGQVGAIGIGPMQAQFGPAGRSMWELSSGIDSRPILPRKQETVIEESLAFPVPVSTIEPVMVGVETLLGRAFHNPLMRGRYARITHLSGAVFNGLPWMRRMVFREPVGGAPKAVQLIGEALRNQPPSGSLEDLSLRMSDLTGEGGTQLSIWSEVRQRENLRTTLAQLEARTGDPSVYALRRMEPWSPLPEERMALVPYVP
jgi:DNA polymerase-4